MPKKARQPEIHLRLDGAVKKQLERFADLACRSLNMQILYYVRRGMEQDAGKPYEDR